MRTQLVVEENIIDLTSELEAQLTFSVDDIADFAKNNSNYSKTIVIPGTAQNNFIFGHIFDINIYNTHNPASQNVGYNYNAAKSARAEVYKDYMLLFKGVVRVLQITINNGFIEYEVALTGELGGLITAIEGKRLTDLDFFEYTTTLTAANIAASWSGTPGEGMYFPLIDYGLVSTGKVDYSYKTFKPALHVKEYIDKIFEAAGYTYESTFLNASFFKKLIIPFNEAGYYISTYIVFDATRVTDQTGIEAIPVSEASMDIIFTNATTNFFDFTAPEADITYQRDGEVSLNVADTHLTYSATNTNLGGDMTLYASITVNGVETGIIGSAVVPANTFGAVGTINLSGTFKANVNDVIRMKFRRVVSAPGLGSNITVCKATNCAIRLDTDKIPIYIGDTISAPSFIPKNIFQKDLLSSIGKMFKLMFYEDRDRDKHLIIEPWINFYDTDLADAVDWTHKQDFGSAIKIKPLGEMTSKIYEWAYKSDSDYYNDLYNKKYNYIYGNYLFDTGYEFVKEKTTVEVIFSPTPMIQYGTNDKITSCFYKMNGTNEETMNVNLRILVRSASPISCDSWDITNGDGGPVLDTFTEYGYAGHLDDPISPTLDINFGSPSQFFFNFIGGYLSANLYNVYWSAYLGEIIDKDSKLLTGKFRLTAADIQNLDFTKFIFIGGQLFRLNKVEDYNTVDEDTTTCELINVINVV